METPDSSLHQRQLKQHLNSAQSLHFGFPALRDSRLDADDMYELVLGDSPFASQLVTSITESPRNIQVCSHDFDNWVAEELDPLKPHPALRVSLAQEGAENQLQSATKRRLTDELLFQKKGDVYQNAWQQKAWKQFTVTDLCAADQILGNSVAEARRSTQPPLEHQRE